ncbi:DUF2637 domain-containing protein [Nonomuraea sp. NBC_00507]|uniref:DUF2637 domain-containing protein n=1 Tax=Nonomuraea sp. NBC_00507 TaxID=2976002 RepID=UPI002E17FEB9
MPSEEVIDAPTSDSIPSDRWIRGTTTAAVVVLAAIAAVVSFRHMRELALAHGEDELAAALIPLAVDGTIVAASMSLLRASRYGARGGLLAWSLLIVSSLASRGANVAVAEPTMIARLIAGWLSLALIGAYEMLMGQIRQGQWARGRGEEGTRQDHQSQSVGGGDDAQPKVAREQARHLHQVAWRWAQENCGPDGRLSSGKAIAVQFSRSPRWGRWIKKAGSSGLLEPSSGDALN